MGIASEPAEWHIVVEGGETRARYEPAATRSGARAVFVCAHGAGGHRDDRSVTGLAETVRACGLDVVRFNFFYTERGLRRPDPMPLLQRCIEAVVARTRAELDHPPVILGGRSMGGRAASMLAAGGFPCQGLLLAAYPLHPAGKPGQLRSAHLPAITVPVLCLNGTRDALCTRELMDRVVATLGGHWTMHWLKGADHAFRVLRSSGRTDRQVLDEIGESVARWLSHLPHDVSWQGDPAASGT